MSRSVHQCACGEPLGYVRTKNGHRRLTNAPDVRMTVFEEVAVTVLLCPACKTYDRFEWHDKRDAKRDAKGEPAAERPDTLRPAS